MRRWSQLAAGALAVLLVASAIVGGAVPAVAQQDGGETPTEENETVTDANETATEMNETATETDETEAPDEGLDDEGANETVDNETADDETEDNETVDNETVDDETEDNETVDNETDTAIDNETEDDETEIADAETETPEADTETPEEDTETPEEETETPEGDAADGEEVTVIDSCTEITEPGRYVLGDNITDGEATEGEDVPEYLANATACIWIRSDDVTLDGNGSLVAGANETEAANGTIGETDGFVKNGTVGDNASAADDAANASAENESYPVGVAVVPQSDDDTVENVTVSNLSATGWFGGVLMMNASESTVDNVTATDNAFAGVILYDVADSVVEDSAASDNDFAGIIHDGLFIEDETNTFADNEIRNNSVVGMDIYESDGNVLNQNVVAGNDVAGVALTSADGARLVSNRITDTAGNESLYPVSGGLLLFESEDLLAVNTTADDNRRWIVYAENGSSFAMNGVTVDARAMSMQGSDAAVGDADAFADDGNVTTVGDGLLATNTSAQNSSLLVGVDWSGAAEQNETPESGPVTETPPNGTDGETETEAVDV